MKITYTAPNRPYDYPYVEALHKLGHLHAFVSGFSRFSPRSPLPFVGNKLKRKDLFQNLYIASLRGNAPHGVSSVFNRLANTWLDQASYRWAKDSDVFIYHRTQGRNTTLRLRKDNHPTLCVMAEVNSHVDVCDALLREEYARLNLGKYKEKFPDHALRLKAYDEADYILCPSDFVKQSFVAKGFAPDRMIKVNFGFSSFKNVSADPVRGADDTFRLLYVGQLHFRKGLRYAIEAFKRLKHPKKEFIIVGPKTPVTGLEDIGIPSNVHFTGPLKGEALMQQYKQASVFILPSLEEGLALVQGEALTFGVPLLITANTGGNDIIKDGVEGFIVQPRDSGAMAERLQQMADDKDLLQRMSFSAAQTARTLGSWDKTAGQLVGELKKILTNRKGK